MTRSITMSARTWAELALLAGIWGFSFLSMHVALHEIGPLTIVAHRTAWAMLILWVWVILRGFSLPRGRSVWAAFFVMGLLNNVIPFSLIAWGQQGIETGLAAILNASTAIWGVLLAALLLPDERLTWARGIGVTIGFLGVITAIGTDVLHSFDLRSLSQLAIIGAAISYGLAGVWARRKLRGLRPEVAAAGMLLCSCLVAVPAAQLVEGPIRFDLAQQTWIALGYVSILATAGAYLLYYRVLAAAGSGNLLLTTLLVAPVAILAGTLILGEALPGRAYLGFALLVIGLAVLDGRILRRKKPLAPAAPPG